MHPAALHPLPHTHRGEPTASSCFHRAAKSLRKVLNFLPPLLECLANALVQEITMERKPVFKLSLSFCLRTELGAWAVAPRDKGRMRTLLSPFLQRQQGDLYHEDARSSRLLRPAGDTADPLILDALKPQA